ncbi:MAG: hypothetical protein J7647_14125 [Cyanobacteria bacterium SBLK]|nr:hypothetical protein [Cyanobacteria bacterium SBLK]
MLNFFRKTQKPSQLSDEAEQEVQREFIRQAKLSFNIALAGITVSSIATLFGAFLLYAGKMSEGAITTGSSILANFGCVQFAEKNKKELQTLLERSKNRES